MLEKIVRVGRLVYVYTKKNGKWELTNVTC